MDNNTTTPNGINTTLFDGLKADHSGELFRHLCDQSQALQALVTQRFAQAGDEPGADLLLLGRLNEALRAADRILEGAAGLSSAPWAADGNA